MYRGFKNKGNVGCINLRSNKEISILGELLKALFYSLSIKQIPKYQECWNQALLSKPELMKFKNVELQTQWKEI